MSNALSAIQVTDDGAVKKITFTMKNIIEETVIHQIGKDVLALVDATPKPKLLISFANVEHLSSAALGVLISCNNRVKVKEGQMVLSDISKPIFEIFRITKLNKLFQIADTADAAMKIFK